MRRWLPALILAVVVVVTLLVFGTAPDSAPSIRSRAPAGLKVAARYLAARGHEVVALEEPDPTILPDGSVLFVALPASRAWTNADALTLASWVRDGGRLVLLAAASSALPLPLEQALGLAAVPQRPEDPGGWEGWEAWKSRQRAIRALSGPVGTLQASDGPWRVACPDRAEVRYQDGGGRARVCTVRHGRGRIELVNDTSVLANARIGLADNLAFLDSLVPDGAPAAFDEHHQGLFAAPSGAYAAQLDAVLLQMALVYLLVAWQRTRPLGPPRPGLADREPGLVAELRTLGRLHAAGGHGVEAARRLLTLARQRFAGDERLATLPDTVERLPEALAVGRRLAEMERRTT